MLKFCEHNFSDYALGNASLDYDFYMDILCA